MKSNEKYIFFRYFYLVVFAMYIREIGPKDYNQTFKAYMDDHAALRDMIAEGRSKLEWERKIPDEKLADLKTQLDCADFKTNLPKVNIQHIFLNTIPLRPLRTIKAKKANIQF